jgi:thiol peroxidase
MEERVGEAFELGEKLTVLGGKLGRGMPAPSFTLDSFDSAAGTMHQIQLSDSNGKVRLLNIVNSLDTPVCHVETQRWQSIRVALLQRAVLVIDTENKIVYVEYLPDQMAEPDYESTVNAIQQAVRNKPS